MTTKREYLLALKRTNFHKDTVNDLLAISNYLKDKSLDKFDKAITSEDMFHVQGYRRALSDLAAKLSLTPQQLDIEIEKARQDGS